jgi:hypothetical protein
MKTDPEDDVFYDEVDALSRQLINAITVLPRTDYNEQITLAAMALITSLVIETSEYENFDFFLNWFAYYMKE